MSLDTEIRAAERSGDLRLANRLRRRRGEGPFFVGDLVRYHGPGYKRSYGSPPLDANGKTGRVIMVEPKRLTDAGPFGLFVTFAEAYPWLVWPGCTPVNDIGWWAPTAEFELVEDHD